MSTYNAIRYNVDYANVGSLKLLSTQTASASASISFTTGLDSTYDEYWFILNNIHPSSEGTNYVSFQASTNGGSSYGVTMTSTYFVTYHSENDTFTALSYQTGSDLAQSTSEQTFNIYGAGADNDQSCSGILKLYNPSSTTYVKHFTFNALSADADDFAVSGYGAGYFNTTSAINGFRFSQRFNNMDDGTIQLFGVKK
jgi:hypothetical protein